VRDVFPAGPHARSGCRFSRGSGRLRAKGRGDTTVTQDSVSSDRAHGATSFAEMLDGLMRFEGSPAEFLARLLEVQCQIAAVDSGAILGLEPEQPVRVLMMHPPPPSQEALPLWIAQCAEAAPRVMEGGTSVVAPMHRVDTPADDLDDATGEHLILIPLRGGSGSRAVAAYLVIVDQPLELERAHERLELAIGLLSLYEMRVSMDARRHDLSRMRGAMELLDATNEQTRFKAVAMAFCNEVAARWNTERVTIGFLKGRYVQTAAISHTEKFDRKMKLLQDLESAMEECLDQDLEIIYPPPDGATCVSRTTGELALRHGPTSVLSLPLRVDGEPVAVVLVERSLDLPFSAEDIETLRLVTDLSTARLVELHTNDKWIGAKAADAAREGFARLVGPRHTWVKVVTAAIILFVLFITVVHGEYRVDAAFSITAIEARVVPSPFDARLERVHVEAGDTVTGGETVLASLETAEIRMRLAAASAERAAFAKESDLALRERETVKMQIAEANLRRVDAEIRLLQHQIDHATLVAPITGTIVVGDLKRQIGGPVATGDVLFEIAALGGLRAELDVPEDRIPRRLHPVRDRAHQPRGGGRGREQRLQGARASSGDAPVAPPGHDGRGQDQRGKPELRVHLDPQVRELGPNEALGLSEEPYGWPSNAPHSTSPGTASPICDRVCARPRRRIASTFAVGRGTSSRIRRTTSTSVSMTPATSSSRCSTAPARSRKSGASATSSSAIARRRRAK